MNINKRLQLERYGMYNLKMPTKDAVDACIVKLHWYKIKKLDIPKISFFILHTMLNPRFKSRYFKQYKTTITDYQQTIIDNGTNKRLHRLVHNIILRKLVYFYINPSEYNNNFEDFAIPWISGIMFSMRTTIMKQMMDDGTIPILFDLSSKSHGYYPFPKPMNNKTTISLANELHDILNVSLDIYIAENLKK